MRLQSSTRIAGPQDNMRHRACSPVGIIVTLAALAVAVATSTGAWLSDMRNADATPSGAAGGRAGDASRRATRRRRSSRSPARPVLDAAATYVPQEQHRRDRHQRVCRLRRPHRRQRRTGAQSGLVLRASEYGFQVKLSVSEERDLGQAQQRQASPPSATTADALAVLGRQFDAIVPVQIGYSRGADMVVVDQRHRLDQPARRQSARGARSSTRASSSSATWRRRPGVPVKVLRDLDSRPGPHELGLVFYEDAFVACDAYAYELKGRQPRLSGCVGWTPKTDEVIAGLQGQAPRCWSRTATCW